MQSEIKAEAASVTILAHYRDAAVDKLTKVARKAARYGQEITWTERPFVETVKRLRWDGKPVAVEVARVEFVITGTAPRVGEFKFISALEQCPGGVLVSSIPGVEVGKSGQQWDGRCEHCGSNRARRFAFVVEAPDGSRKIVGKSCLRDHLGTDVPAGLISQFQWEPADMASADEDGFSWGGSGRWEESTIGVIAATRAAIALWGWRPSSHEGWTTAFYVNLVFGRIERDDKGREIHAEERRRIKSELAERGDHYQAEADKVLEWGRNLPGRSDYEHNLKVALAGDIVIGKTFNLVVSACAGYDRQIAREDEAKARRIAEEEARANMPQSDYVGSKGERITATVTVEAIIGLPDYGYGPSVLYKLRSDDGPILAWKTQGVANVVAGKRLEVGSRAVVTATVKDHAEFRGVKETRVLRAKFAPVAE